MEYVISLKLSGLCQNIPPFNMYLQNEKKLESHSILSILNLILQFPSQKLSFVESTASHKVYIYSVEHSVVKEYYGLWKALNVCLSVRLIQIGYPDL